MHVPVILIAEREEAVRDSLQIVLSDEGYRCFSYSNEEEVLEALEKEVISVIILGSQLAVGKGLLQIIKEQYPQIKSIVISSYAALERVQMSLKDLNDRIILKPFDFEELVSLVGSLYTA